MYNLQRISKEKLPIRIYGDFRSDYHTKKHDAKKCKMKINVTWKNCDYIWKKIYSLPLSPAACAPLMMSVFSHLIITFACILPLWLIAGPKKKGNQHLICPVWRSAALFLCLFPIALIHSTLSIYADFKNKGAWIFFLDSCHLLGNAWRTCHT